MTKTKKCFEEMVANNKELFEEFEGIHTQYIKDKKKHQAAFNAVGGDVLKVIQDYENRLCGTSENSGFGKYSGKLAEKFRAEVRVSFPLIDYVGIKIL